MKYKMKYEVDAQKWYPMTIVVADAFDTHGVEYTDEGWFLNGDPIAAGDWIVDEGEGMVYAMPEDAFLALFEAVETESPIVLSS
jgi:hypothetical protein